jgi:uncharacterized protein (DUF488 family)
MDRLFTIGVYGFDAETFFRVLQGENVDLLLDLRRRRGVRGAAYAFANVTRLRVGLEELDITYRHIIGLAPQEETRALQFHADAAARVAKRKRTTLSSIFADAYTRHTLESFDWDSLLAELHAFRRPVLLCVEQLPDACHRSLVARRLANSTGVPVTDLMP